jgi:hypothetical protein
LSKIPQQKAKKKTIGINKSISSIKRRKKVYRDSKIYFLLSDYNLHSNNKQNQRKKGKTDFACLWLLNTEDPPCEIFVFDLF